MVSDPLKAIVDDFVAKLRAYTRREAIDAMQAALGGAASPRRRPPTKPARVRKGATRRKGQKRNPTALAALVGRLAAEIKAKPGKRVEEIGRALRVPTKELALPIKKLLATRKIRKTGTRRATKYFPA